MSKTNEPNPLDAAYDAYAATVHAADDARDAAIEAAWDAYHAAEAAE